MFTLRTISLSTCLLLVLSACNIVKPAEEPPPIVEVQGTGTVLKTIQVDVKATTQNAKLGHEQFHADRPKG